MDLLREGVVIERGRHGSNSGRVRTAPAQIRQVREGDNPWYEVVLIEGRNRELRKMFEEIGHHVEKIRRVGYGPLVLDQEPGKLRELEADEVHKLRLTAEGKLKPKRRRVPSVARLEPEAGRAVRFGKDDRRRAPARGGEFTAAPSRQSVRDVSTGIATGKRMAGSAPPQPAGRPDRTDRPARFDKPARPYKPGFDKSGFDKPRYDKPKFEKPGFDKPARSARPAKFDQPRQAERDSPQGRPAGRPMHIVAEGAEGAESPKKSFRPEAQKPFRPAAPKPDAPTKPPTGRERTGRHPREDDYVLTKTPGFRIEPVVEAPREQRPPRPAGAFRPSGERRPAASAGFKGAAKPFERKPSERGGERRAPEGRPFRPAGKPFRSADKPFRLANKPGDAGARPAGGRSASGDRPFRGPDKPFRSSDKPFRPSEKPFRSDDKPFRPSSRPAGTRPTGTRPAGTRPAGTRPAGARSGGSFAGSGRPAGRPRRDAEGGEGRPREFRPRTAPEGGRGFGDKPSRPAAGGPKREETGGGRVKNRWRNSFTGKNKGRPKPKPKKDS